jgi:hypothetical protein
MHITLWQAGAHPLSTVRRRQGGGNSSITQVADPPGSASFATLSPARDFTIVNQSRW